MPLDPSNNSLRDHFRLEGSTYWRTLPTYDQVWTWEPVDLSFKAWLILRDFEASAVYEMKNGSPKLKKKN